MPKVKTITLNGGETAVKFEKSYSYYFVSNMGDNGIYASANPNITAYADGVYTILPGMEIRISPEKSADTVYLFGSGKVQVRAEEIAVPVSFRLAPKGGEGVGLESKIVDALPETGESSFLYLVPKNDLLTDNIYDEYLWVGGNWEKIGSTELSVNTDYNELENKPSIGGVELDGNKTLAELGISTSSFDGKYSSLSGKPVVYTNNNYNAEVFKGWYRMCEIHNVTDSFAGILILEFVPGGGYTQNIICAVGWTNSAGPFCKIISSSGQADMVTQIRFSYINKNPNYPLYIDIYKSYSTSAIANVTLLCNPKSSLQERNITLAPISDTTVPTGFNSKTFDITEPKIPTADAALSDTSTNAVQNKAVTEAINTKIPLSNIIQEITDDASNEQVASAKSVRNFVTSELADKNNLNVINLGKYIETTTVGDVKQILLEFANSIRDKFAVGKYICREIWGHIVESASDDILVSSFPGYGVYTFTPLNCFIESSGLYGSFLISSYGTKSFISIYYCVIQSGIIVKCIDLSKPEILPATYTTVGGIKSGGDITVTSDGTSVVQNLSRSRIALEGKPFSEFKQIFFQELKKFNAMEKWSPLFFGGDMFSLLAAWNDDDAIITGRSAFQITPIGANAIGNEYGSFILSTYDVRYLYYFVATSGVFSDIQTIYTTANPPITPEQKAILDSITPEMLEKLKNL